MSTGAAQRIAAEIPDLMAMPPFDPPQGVITQ
jgi:hypothetical protein